MTESSATSGSSSSRFRRLRLVLASVCLGWLLLGLAGPVLAASPDPSPGGDYGGDTRTAGQGPGLVGSPLYAIGAVLLVALVSIGLAQVYLRLTPGPAPAGQPPKGPPGTNEGLVEIDGPDRGP
jgi:hypothetical protein